MKIFIWQSVSKLTRNWHDGGGLVIVAESLEDARALLRTRESKGWADTTDSECTAYTTDPDLVMVLGHEEVVEPQAFIFPDAGCC